MMAKEYVKMMLMKMTLKVELKGAFNNPYPITVARTLLELSIATG